MDTNPRDLDALLAHSGWARALARSLVRDPGRADDLVQRAWLAALRTPPGEGTPPRRWLATVLRNFARQDVREASRRERRETAVARSESADGSSTLDESAEIQIRLISAVRELPEPSRSAVWARYYEGLAPREIAARDGVSIYTVKTRIARGLDALRRRLDREHRGDRQAWIAALVPLAGSQPLMVSTIGGISMGAAWKAAAVLALVAVGAATWITAAHVEPASPPVAESASLGLEADTARVVDRAVEVEASSDKVTRAPVEPTRGNAGSTEGDAALVRGRVLDLERRPVPRLEVRTVNAPRGPKVQSADDGTFAIPRDHVGTALEATGPGWATVFTGRLPRAGYEPRVTILVAPAGKLGGSVVDPLGQPVSGATVDVEFAESTPRARADVIGADPHRIGYTTVSDADGRFDLGEVPLIEGTIRARLDGRESRAVAIPDRARADLLICFDPPGVEDIVVRGSVGSAPDMRISGAYVRIGTATQRTGEDGSFSLLVRPADLRGAELELVAVSENQSPTRVTFDSLGDLYHRAASETFDLVLGEDPRRISGRVVDLAGNPLPSARVHLDEEWFGIVTTRSVGRPPRMGLTVESILRGEPNSGIEPEEDTDVFSIGGLQDRDYRMVVTSTDPPAIRVLERVHAGTSDLVVALDTGGPALRVAGRVVDEEDRPLVGVGVTADLDLGADSGPITSRRVTTNSEGAFELTRLRGRVVEVTAHPDLDSSIGVELERGDSLDDVRIVVPIQRAIQVDITSRPGYATDFQIHGARGAIDLRSTRTVLTGSESYKSARSAVELPILDGLSDVVTVTGNGLTLVLLREGREVARVPIVFAAEGVTILRP